MNFEYLTPEAIYQYTLKRSQKASSLLDELWDYTHQHTEAPKLLTGPIEGNFLNMLVGIAGVKRILEIGTFTGYSALWMAGALPDDGMLTTCELNPQNIGIAQMFFDRSEDGKKIRIQQGPALKTMQEMIESDHPPFDLIFVDADKKNYPRYFQKCLNLTQVGSLIVFDNTLWSGRVLEENQDEETQGIDRLNILAAQDPHVQNVLLTIRDGIQLMRRVK
ncbi:MAG: class I SAM-dependent methyltransferase [Bdellovibrionota bacterium]